MMEAFVLIAVVMTILTSQTLGQVPFNENMKSFSHAQKEGFCVTNEEVILFERFGQPGVITEQWFTGHDCFQNDSIIRYYIDDNSSPAIEGELFLMHGIGFYDASRVGAWGNKWLGHLAENGGLYNTFRIPYQNSIRVTVETKVKKAREDFKYWFILRGVENYPVVIGDLILPPTARLRLQKIERKTFKVFEYINVASSEKKNGLIFMVTLAGQSRDFNYLEGCYRVCTRNNTDVQYLSSGTEDFFMSAYYFNKGIFHTEHAGVTYIQSPGTMSAYKIFSSDPILFKDSFHLIWRQSENHDTACYTRTGTETCHVTDEGEVVLTSQTEREAKIIDSPMYGLAEISSYVWFYEW